MSWTPHMIRLVLARSTPTPAFKPQKAPQLSGAPQQSKFKLPALRAGGGPSPKAAQMARKSGY